MDGRIEIVKGLPTAKVVEDGAGFTDGAAVAIKASPAHQPDARPTAKP